MMVVAEGDDITLWDLEIDTFNAIPCPRKELVVLPHTTHITLYSDKARGMMADEAGLRWLHETLRYGERFSRPPAGEPTRYPLGKTGQVILSAEKVRADC